MNGRTYASLDQVPADLRSACERALREAGAPATGGAGGPAGALPRLPYVSPAAGAVLFALTIRSLLRA